MNSGDVLRCSFCNKAQREVRKLIAGPTVYICDECIEICVEIISEDTGVKAAPPQQSVKQVEMAVRPSFKNLTFTKRVNHCFYLSPFSEPFNTIYDGYVTPAAVSEGFTIVRADQLYGTAPVIEDIWAGINEAEFIIADVTGRNANVAYEIGIAHTVGKPVVMTAQNMGDVPFDLRHLRCIVYKNNADGYRQLQHKIAATLRAVRASVKAG